MVQDGAEVAPVHLGLAARRGLDGPVDAACPLGPNPRQVTAQGAGRAGVTAGHDLLVQGLGKKLGKGIQPFFEVSSKGSDLAAALPGNLHHRFEGICYRSFQVFGYRLAVKAYAPRNLAGAQALTLQMLNLHDFSHPCQLCSLLWLGRSGLANSRTSPLQRGEPFMSSSWGILRGHF